MENTPTIETQRLLLRRFTPADVEAVYRIYSDRQANRFLPWYPVQSREEAAVLLTQRYLEFYRKPAAAGYRYAVCLRDDNTPVGYIHVSGEDARDFGYGLRRDFWNRGLATEAGSAVIRQLRQDGVPFITAPHDRNNPASGRVMQKIGMTYRYSYEEQWQPKNIPVIFRMYQLDFLQPGSESYKGYWNTSEMHFIEADI